MPTKQKSGFTLVELIVTVAVMAIILAVMLANYNAGGADFRVENQTRQVMALLRKAEAFANASKKFNSQLPSGYGVNLEVNKNPVLFANFDGNKIYDAGVDGAVETLPLSAGLKIGQVAPIGVLNIFYEPPKRDIYINGVSVGGASVTIADAQSSATRVLNITSHGQISIAN